jgi:hypothetical protein
MARRLSSLGEAAVRRSVADWRLVAMMLGARTDGTGGRLTDAAGFSAKMPMRTTT